MHIEIYRFKCDLLLFSYAPTVEKSKETCMQSGNIVYKYNVIG